MKTEPSSSDTRADANAAQSIASSAPTKHVNTKRVARRKHSGVHPAVTVVKHTAAGASDDVHIQAPLPGEVMVSDRDLNQFIFPVPISQVIMPAGTPVSQSIYLSNNTQVLLQFQKGYDKDIQFLAEAENGQVFKLYLKPRPINGITYRADARHDATPVASSAQAAGQSTAATNDPTDATPGEPSARGEDIELLKRVVKGDVPAGFDQITLPAPTRFDKFTAVPLTGWSDGARRVLAFSLVSNSGQSAVVAPPQFYRQGITAVMLTGDSVTPDSSPQLFVVEELSDE
ncbi:type-F conjugative transfer system secretin TraK [Paraburkholderia sp. UCT31]|uniref:TraK domain-containing protein n=1 Tax=Paraburkholderia sp. UCT31 TaxID=2615209 RepID=UPI0016552CE2|nr:type-F conjugative transfer system secretin TraK [Paraburkholderia sp. UCT31]